MSLLLEYLQFIINIANYIIDDGLEDEAHQLISNTIRAISYAYELDIHVAYDKASDRYLGAMVIIPDTAELFMTEYFTPYGQGVNVIYVSCNGGEFKELKEGEHIDKKD